MAINVFQMEDSLSYCVVADLKGGVYVFVDQTACTGEWPLVKMAMTISF